MKKTYKLIKWYPSLPIGWKDEEVIMAKYCGKYCKEGVSAGTPYSEEEIENEPEFWEEIKEFEILSIWNSNDSPRSRKLFEKCSNGKFKWGGENGSEFSNYITGERLLEGEFNTIHSVKRFSDNEVFNVGDEIQTDKKYYIIGKIVSIDLETINGVENTLVMTARSRLNETQRCFYIEKPFKVKKPLFTTEDNKEIFIGDKYFYINIGTPNPNWTPINYTQKDDLGSMGTKQFLTKEKAEEYILENKPCLSYNDVMNNFRCIDENLYIYLGKSTNLKKLIKDRL